MSRESFLARVREAAEVGRVFRVQSKPVDAMAGRLGRLPGLVERLTLEVNAAGGQAIAAPSVDGARVHLRELLVKCRAASALCWRHPVLDRIGMGELLAELKIERWDYDTLNGQLPDEVQRRMNEADVGITGTHWAIAETGTLALAAGPGSERLASLLPPVHVAVVEEAQIVPDLFDVFQVLESAGLESLTSNLTLITGPSKTGDIELRLTTGVHGPAEWHVIIIRSGGS